MSERIYGDHEESKRPLVWMHGEVRTPPMSSRARAQFGILLRQLQSGESLGMPQSRPMPSVGARCHELRVADGRVSWRLVCRLDRDAVIILDVFGKRTAETPHPVLEACRERLRRYDSVAGDER